MSFIPKIFEKRHEFYLNFVEEVFVQDFWEKVLNEEQAACAFLCAFYTTVKSRCNTSNEETSEIEPAVLGGEDVGKINWVIHDFLARGAAALLPEPPCSTKTLIAY